MGRDSVRSPTSDAESASRSTLAPPTAGSSPRSFASANASGAQPALVVNELHKAARLRGVSLTASDGETLVILGPSGAGKTSLLRMLAGLEIPDRGEIRLDGADLARVPAHRRRVAMVFQDDALFAHMTIAENLAFGARARHAAVRQERIRAVAQSLGIADLLERRPAKISGGERQRAALARAVLSDPRVLLLDEPFAHLDPQLRARVRRDFMQFRAAFFGAAIHVTHDHVEALCIADRLAIMMNGRIVQLGDPAWIYEWPATVEVARFFGSPPMNLLHDRMEIMGIRPEHVRIEHDAPLRGRVVCREFSGADVFVHAQTPCGEATARLTSAHPIPALDEEIGLAFDARFVRRFDRTTGELLQ